MSSAALQEVFSTPAISPQIASALLSPFPKQKQKEYKSTKDSFLRSRQLLLQESLLDEILGPNSENIPRLKEWVRSLFVSEPKLATQLLTKLLPTISPEEAPQTNINNTLVIVDQTSDHSLTPGFSLSTKDIEPDLLPTTTPTIPTTPIEEKKPKFHVPIKRSQRTKQQSTNEQRYT